MKSSRSIKLLVMLALAASLVAGCGSGAAEADLVGTWTGKMSMNYKAMQQDAAADTAQAQMYQNQLMDGDEMTLTLRSDGTAELLMQRAAQEGTWSLSGSTVTLELDQAQGEQMLGQAGQGSQVENKYLFEVTDGGKKMEAPDPNIEGVTLKFEKGS